MTEQLIRTLFAGLESVIFEIFFLGTIFTWIRGK